MAVLDGSPSSEKNVANRYICIFVTQAHDHNPFPLLRPHRRSLVLQRQGLCTHNILALVWEFLNVKAVRQQCRQPT